MKLRNESQLVTAILQYLQTKENLGEISWVDRLNSGRFRIGKYFIRGCRSGTPDIYAILNDGTILWIECKSESGILSEDQIRFKRKILGLQHHIYIIAYCLDDVDVLFRN